MNPAQLSAEQDSLFFTFLETFQANATSNL